MKIVKTGQNRIKVTVNVGDCEVDIIVKRIMEKKPRVHIEDIPVDCRRDNLNAILNILTMALSAFSLVAVLILMITLT